MISLKAVASKIGLKVIAEKTEYMLTGWHSQDVNRTVVNNGAYTRSDTF